jgi:hypothetical protein
MPMFGSGGDGARGHSHPTRVDYFAKYHRSHAQLVVDHARPQRVKPEQFDRAPREPRVEPAWLGQRRLGGRISSGCPKFSERELPLAAPDLPGPLGPGLAGSWALELLDYRRRVAETHEHQVQQQPTGPPIAIQERMDPLESGVAFSRRKRDRPWVPFEGNAAKASCSDLQKKIRHDNFHGPEDEAPQPLQTRVARSLTAPRPARARRSSPAHRRTSRR